MQCKKCSGRGMIWYDDEHYGACNNCISGVASCCEVDDALSVRDIEPPLKKAKVNREIYEAKKDDNCIYLL